MLSIFGASLSEPHIDRDNVPRRGECLYLAACSVCPPQCSREHAYSINNTCTLDDNAHCCTMTPPQQAPANLKSCRESLGTRLANSWYKDLNWLAVLTDSVYKLELHAATMIGTTLRRRHVHEKLLWFEGAL